MADLEQWVNLEKKAALEEDGITQENMGACHFECEFDNGKLSSFKVKVVEVPGDRAKYKGNERKRNKNFRLRPVGAATNNEKSKVKLERDVFLPAAGGNQFRIGAKYKGEVVESQKMIKVRRKIWYQVMKMRPEIEYSTSTLEDTYWDEKNKLYIKLKQSNPGAADEITLVENVDSDDDDKNFIAAAKAKWSLADRKPYGFALAFVRYIASSIDWEYVNLDVTALMGGYISFTVRSYLWHGIVSTDDVNKRWLIDVTLTWAPTGSTKAGGTPYSVDWDDVSIGGSDAFAHGGRDEVLIDTGPLAQGNYPTQPAGTGTWYLDLELREVDGWSNGFAYNEIALLAVAKRTEWKDQSADVIKYTINHEVGHMLGMVADGKRRAPNAPPKLYGDKPGKNDRDHTGPHCGRGATWHGKKRGWSGAPKCVMFGADAADSPAPPTYCKDCIKIVRKLDLGPAALKTGSFKTAVDDW